MLNSDVSNNRPSGPIVRRKLSDEVLLRLKHMITDGELRPGDTMPSERELMERFGVGRPAIREAMQSLANMGLVAISHGERAKLLQLSAQSIIQQVDATARMMLSSSPDSLDHLKAARIFFERGMVREAATRAGEDDVQALQAILEEQRAALGDAGRFIAADMRFHIRIVSTSGNPIYAAIAEAMLGWLKEYHTDMLIWTGKEKFTLAEHSEIIEAIARHNPDEAEAALTKHLERSSALYTLNGLSG